jgi:hypothetical protein
MMMLSVGGGWMHDDDERSSLRGQALPQRAPTNVDCEFYNYTAQ